MRRSFLHAPVALIPALLLMSCSLMGLDDFGVVPCQSNADCQNVEARLKPGPNACGAAVCQADSGLCKWQEHVETCNGKDDDCDGLIDEGLVFDDRKSSVDPALSGAVAYASASSATQTFVAVTGTDGSSAGFVLDAEQQSSELRYESVSDRSPVYISELALAADTQHLIVASINTYGCAAGKLRVGLSNLAGAPFEVRLGKDPDAPTEEESNLVPGVDVDGGGCTGASRDELPLGATRPAVASLGTQAGGQGALLLWLAASATSDVPADGIAVEALGLVVPQVKPEWLNGANGGVPAVLGRTTALSAPAVVALESRSKSYIVAFPTQQAPELGIQLLTIEVNRAGPQISASNFLPVGAADQVSLALGNSEREEVGLAWHTSSGASAELRFMVISTSLEPVNQTSFSAAEPRSAPQILYRSAGFVEAEPSGGWYLSWVEGANDELGTWHVARLRESTLQTLNDAPVHTAVTAPLVLYPKPGDDGSGVGYAFIPPGATAAETFPNWCQ
jgi:hypothetical protein